MNKVLEIICKYIEQLEEEIEWYQEKNREWQNKCETLEQEKDMFESHLKIARSLNESKNEKLLSYERIKKENARLREQLRWHPVSELPPVDNTTKRKRMSVDVLLKRPSYSTVIAWHIRDRNEWWSYDKGQILVPLGSEWCYIPEGGDA